MDEGDEEWLFESLKALDSSISEILEFQVEVGSKKGDNYSNDVFRIKLDLKDLSGRIVKKSVILKCTPRGSGTHGQVSLRSDLIVKEVRLYREVLSKMVNIIKTQSKSYNPMFPTFIGAQYESKILLEDLTVSGYKICGNRIGLDFDHSALFLGSLGKFHALGAILKEKNELHVNDYCSYYYEEKKEFCVKLFRNNFNELAWILENKWKGEWLDYAQRLRQVADSVGLDLINVYRKSENRFNTFLHGDCCFLNIMFTNGENGSPIDVRLLDFQNCWVNSVGFDLNYFLWMSLHPEVWPRKAELIKLYHKSLSHHLRLYGYAMMFPDLQEIVDDCRRTDIYGFAISISLLGFLMQPPDRIPDMGKISFCMSSESEDSTFISREHSETENYKRTIQLIIKTAASLGLI